MKIIPAIDLIDGQSVRLAQGDYQEKLIMPMTPQEAIQYYSQFERVGRIHIVDLIGAAEQMAMETSLIAELRQLTHLPIEIGGGLRELATIDYYADLGIDYFVLGTRGIMDLNWLAEVVDKYPGRVYVGADARGESIYINGWKEASGVSLNDYIAAVDSLDLAGIIYTDISRDGMEQGPNVMRTGQLNRMSRHPVVASGGVRNGQDLAELEAVGVQEAIVGKAAQSDEFWRGI